MSELGFELPGKNCGACGFRSCAAMAERLDEDPELIRRCIQLSPDTVQADSGSATTPASSKSPADADAWRDSVYSHAGGILVDSPVGRKALLAHETPSR